MAMHDPWSHIPSSFPTCMTHHGFILLLFDSATQPHGKRGSSAGDEGGEDEDEEGGGAGAGGSFLGKEETGGKGATRCVGWEGGRGEGEGGALLCMCGRGTCAK